MLPIPTRKIFRNRWWTLAWAAGICWTAVEMSGGAHSHRPSTGNASGTAADAADGTPDGAAVDAAAAALDAQ